ILPGSALPVSRTRRTSLISPTHSPQTAPPPVVTNCLAQPHRQDASADPGTRVPPSQPPRCSTSILRIRTARIYATSKCSSVWFPLGELWDCRESQIEHWLLPG